MAGANDYKIVIEVYGVAEAIRELKDLDKKAYNRIVRDLKTSAQPLARAVGQEFPEEPLMNWHTSGERLKTASRFPPYNGAAVRSSVKVAFNTRLRKRSDTVGIVRIQQMDGAGMIYDSAGKQSRLSKQFPEAGRQFIHNLDKHLTTKSVEGQTRSRIMYPATKKHLKLLYPAIQESLDRTCKVIEQNINGK